MAGFASLFGEMTIKTWRESGIYGTSATFQAEGVRPESSTTRMPSSCHNLTNENRRRLSSALLDLGAAMPSSSSSPERLRDRTTAWAGRLRESIHPKLGLDRAAKAAYAGFLGRGGRVVEGARLLSEYTAKSRIVGSNPILSASRQRSAPFRDDGQKSIHKTIH